MSKEHFLPRFSGKNWLDKFRTRHLEIQGIQTRKIDNSRCKDVNKEVVQAVTDLVITHHYPPERIYYMDESGFTIGDSQSSRAFVRIREPSTWKMISGRQEWVSAIECVGHPICQLDWHSSSMPLMSVRYSRSIVLCCPSCFHNI